MAGTERIYGRQGEPEMKVVVTGVRGQLGHDVVNELEKRGHIAVGTDVEEMDITDAGKVREVLTSERPDAVIHCAAYTAVDAAEDNVELCRRINAQGTENIAKVCGDLDCRMLYLSTDYVFNGEGERPWEPDDEREPLNVYGQTKYEGELAVETYVEKFFIVRIAWVFGVNGKNFIKTMLRLGKDHDELTVVADQIRFADLYLGPVPASRGYDRVRPVREIPRHERGTLQLYEFAVEIFRQAGMDVRVRPVTSEEYPAKAKRPHNSRMDKSKLEQNGFRRLPDWKDSLTRYLDVLREAGEL